MKRKPLPTPLKRQAVLKGLSLLLLLFSLLPFTACQHKIGQDLPSEKEKKTPVLRVDFADVFDTASSILAGEGVSEVVFEEQAQKIHEKLLDYHRLLDIYHEYEGLTNLASVNRMAGQGPVKISQELMDYLLFAQNFYEESMHRVNPLFGAVLLPWHEAREEAIAHPDQARLPEEAVLKEAARHCDPQHLRLDPEAGTVEITDPFASIDSGAIGKGYSTERVAQFAEQAGFHHLLLNIGGNLRAVGRKGEDEDWKVAIQNPENDQARERPYLLSLQLHSGSMVTSGNYERYFMYQGKRYHHIIDPETLYPSKGYKSITVIAEDSGLADASSTTLFLSTLEEGQAFVKAHPGMEALWVLDDGRIYASEHFTDKIVKSYVEIQP